MDVKASIGEEAGKIGIDMLGFASCELFTAVEKILKEREEKGYLSGFEEKDIQKRVNPRLAMEDCRTIIAAGISYNVKEDRVTKREDYKYKCNISRSSWGIDYHIVLRGKLEKLSKFIEESFGGKCKYFVDTGPLVEREVARKAGIGYIGKNCALINPNFGSFIFLGEIITDLYIEPDSPLDDSCGDCDLCIKACPSGALCSPYEVNAKKCISYITQSRELPVECCESLGNNLYGCDICQKVCPKNKAARESVHKEFLPELWNYCPDAMDILELNNRKFLDTFKKTSSGWRGRKTLQRNAIIAMGNSKDRQFVPYIEKMLMDDRSEIREASVKALYNLLKEECSDILREHLKKEKDECVSKVILDLLNRTG